VDVYLAMLTEDVVEEYPQSGECFAGRATLRAIAEACPGYPSFTIRRRLPGGNPLIAAGSTDYGEGGLVMTVFTYEFRGSQIARETAD
jgi:hypothetical protein